MLRVFRTDMYRLFRSKAFYVYPIFMAVIILFSMIFIAENKEVENGGTDRKDGITIENSESVPAEANGKNIEQAQDSGAEKHIYISWGMLFESLFDGVAILFVGITFIIFCTCETRNGFIKNTVGCVTDRGYMVVSKILVGIVIVISYTIEYAIISTIMNFARSLITGVKLEWLPVPDGDAPRFVSFILLCFLMDIAIITILALVHELTFSRAIGIIVIFGISTTLFGQFAHGAVELLRHVFGILKDFNIGKYLMIENTSEGYVSSNFYPQTLLTMCLIYITVCTILSLCVVRRKDIR